jgi:hypothetical protein
MQGIMEFSRKIPIKFDGRGSWTYFPGETLAGSYFLDELGDVSISAVEVSVLWQTEGKGNSDFGIHDFWRRSVADGDWIDNRTPGRFHTTLPNSPLSYDGELIKIYWLVRVRVFTEDGREFIDEHAFRLGNLTHLRLLQANIEKKEPSLVTSRTYGSDAKNDAQTVASPPEIVASAPPSDTSANIETRSIADTSPTELDDNGKQPQ